MQKTAKERETSIGTAIAITKNLCCYIYNIQCITSTAIAIDLFLPHNNRIRLISLYQPSNNPVLLQTINTILES